MIGLFIVNDLIGIFFCFCCYKYGFIIDIEKVFLYVSFDEGDRDVICFFWLSDLDDFISIFYVYCFKVVLFGVLSFFFILNVIFNKYLN